MTLNRLTIYLNMKYQSIIVIRTIHHRSIRLVASELNKYIALCIANRRLNSNRCIRWFCRRL